MIAAILVFDSINLGNDVKDPDYCDPLAISNTEVDGLGDRNDIGGPYYYIAQAISNTVEEA